METSWYVNFYKKRVPCASLSYIDIRKCERALQSSQCASVTRLLLLRVKDLMLFEGITNTEIKQVFLINKKHLLKCYKNAITLGELNIGAFIVSKLISYATTLLFGRFCSPF